MSKTIKKKVKEGTWHLSFSKSRIHEYKGIKFHGKWEVEYAKWLDKNEIQWRRPTEEFQYQFDDGIHFDTPDFYLIDSNEYVEIKGCPVEKDRAKWNDFPLSLKILNGKDLFKLGLIKEIEIRSINFQFKEKTWI